MRFSRCIVNFDQDHFDFLQDELKSLGKDICEKFNEKFVKRPHVFGLVDVLIEKIAYGLLLFKNFCHCFYCWRGIKTAGKCDFCTRLFIDDNDLGVKIDREFVLTKKSIEQLPICNLMDQVKTRSVVLNLCYLVGDYAVTISWGLETMEKYFLRLQTILLVSTLFICRLTSGYFSTFSNQWLKWSWITICLNTRKESTVPLCLAILRLEVNY